RHTRFSRDWSSACALPIYWVLGFLDAWTNPWAYAGCRTPGSREQRLFVHGPGWTGDVPAGMHRISAPGDDVWIIGRILADADPRSDERRVGTRAWTRERER